MQTEVQSTISFKVAEEYSERFAQFFPEFERDLEMLGIKNFGISKSTLEEVFFKIGGCRAPNDAIETPRPVDRPSQSDVNPWRSMNSNDQTYEQIKRSGQGLSDPLVDNEVPEREIFSMQRDQDKLDTGFCTNFCAVLHKRLLSYWRSPFSLCSEIVLPIIAMIIISGTATGLY